MATYSYSGNKKHKKKQNHASEYLPYLINELADEIEVVEQVLSGGEEGQALTADSAGKAKWAASSCGGGGGITDILYADLVVAIMTSALVVGGMYRITDFATTHYIVDGDGTQYTTGDGVIVGTVEPLIVTAIAVDKIHTEAKSELHPEDVIYYDWNPSNWLTNPSFASRHTIIPGWKGVIISRYDTAKEIQAPSDWRNCVTRRWNTNAPAWAIETTYSKGSIVSHENSGKVYKSVVDSNVGNEPSGQTNSYWHVLLDLSSFTYFNASPVSWNGVPSATTYDDFPLFQDLEYSKCVYIKTCPEYLLPQSTFIGTVSFVTIAEFFKNNTIHHDFSYNTVSDYFESNVIGEGFNNNTIASMFRNNITNSYFLNNTTQGEFYNNAIGDSFSNNVIGDYFSNNVIGDYFSANMIGYRFITNTIFYNFRFNTIAADFSNNTIGDEFNNNTTRGEFNNNAIGKNFENNVVGSQFTSNIIDEYFARNVVGYGFSRNTIGYGFLQNTVSDYLTDTDFSSAQYVYNPYDCVLFKREDNTYRLRYFDSSDVQQIVAVTA